MATYHVEYLKNKTFPLLKDPKAVEYLKKWSLDTGLHLSGWAFNEPYQPLHAKQLIESVLKKAHLSDQPLPERDETLKIEAVPCSITSMEFFDRLLDPANGVTNRSGDGSIRGCFEETWESFIVCDELRQMLLNEASDVYPLFSRMERGELLFRLLLHCALGGQWCQYEDVLQPYIDFAVLVYKSILNVQKDKDTSEIRIRSKCFRVILAEETNIQNFIYVLIDPGLREVTLLAHKF